MGPLVTVSGEEADVPPNGSIKRFVLDWSGMLAIVGVAVNWGTTSSHVGANTREIERLRAANESRAVSDVRTATEMATKSDVQRLSDQIQALSLEFRRARDGR
jgi:hypothetical protein